MVLFLPGLGVGVTEGDEFVEAVEDVTLAMHTAVELACEVDEHGVTSADVFAVNDPMSDAVLGWVEAVVTEGVAHFGAKHAAEVAFIEQAARLLSPQVQLGREGTGGHQDVGMRGRPAAEVGNDLPRLRGYLGRQSPPTAGFFSVTVE